MSSTPGVARLAVRSEQERQYQKWGDQSTKNDLVWLSILVEEVGELAQALNDERYEDAYHELVQVTAVAQTWLEGRV